MKLPSFLFLVNFIWERRNCKLKRLVLHPADVKKSYIGIRRPFICLIAGKSNQPKIFKIL